MYTLNVGKEEEHFTEANIHVHALYTDIKWPLSLYVCLKHRAQVPPEATYTCISVKCLPQDWAVIPSVDCMHVYTVFFCFSFNA